MTGSPDFLEIHEEYREVIRMYLLRLTRGKADEADDLTQEVFVRAHGNLESLREETTVKSWLYRIASNLFIDRSRLAAERLRKGMSRLEPGSGVDPEDRATRHPDEASIRSEQAACVDEYVDSLPPDYRTVLVLHDMEGLTNPEIAEVLECSLATVKIRLHRARERLRAKMDKGCNLSLDDRGTLVCDPKEKKRPEDE